LKTPKRTLLVLPLVLSLAAVACGGADEPEPPEQEDVGTVSQPLWDTIGCQTYTEAHNYAAWLCAIRGRGGLRRFEPIHQGCGSRYGAFHYWCNGTPI
jgi:hypothetical protein